MVIKDLLPGRPEAVVLVILLSIIFSYEITGFLKKLVKFFKR